MEKGLILAHILRLQPGMVRNVMQLGLEKTAAYVHPQSGFRDK